MAYAIMVWYSVSLEYDDVWTEKGVSQARPTPMCGDPGVKETLDGLISLASLHDLID